METVLAIAICVAAVCAAAALALSVKTIAVRRTLADKVVYDKIVDIVRHDGTVTDVIARLIDSSVFDNADEAARERYVLTAAATYRKVKREYESRAAAGNVAL